jgi:type II secretory pathway pseudopilin PulG
MAQRQILLLVLGVCILGIVMSVGAISLQQQSATENRNEVVTQLRRYATDVQSFYRRPLEEGGGGGSFLILTATPNGLNRFSAPPKTVHGDFNLRKTGCASAAQIIGIGVVSGNNPRLPVRAMITVYPDSSFVSVLN